MARTAAQASNEPLALSASRVFVDDLQVCCDPVVLAFEDMSAHQPLPDLIGQTRALDAICLAANINHADFNQFVLGPDGAPPFAEYAHAPRDFIKLSEAFGSFEDE